ncbi:hypothetical protein GOODEAATRI_031908 [Goodea atripinnis]|uniref:Uncharacterized protein n=1 Tax=Goodea atripinnis TaxID=208336 RepID=A0ABV0NPU9_9TELE
MAVRSRLLARLTQKVTMCSSNEATIEYLFLGFFLIPVVTSCSDLSLPLDCSDIYNQDTSRPSGVYTIYPIGTTSAVQVHSNLQQ